MKNKIKALFCLPLFMLLLGCPGGIEIRGDYNSSKIKFDDDIEGVWQFKAEEGQGENPLFIIEKKDDYWAYLKLAGEQGVDDMTLHELDDTVYIAIKGRKGNQPFEMFEFDFNGDDEFIVYPMEFSSEFYAEEFKNTPGSSQEAVFESFVEKGRIIRDASENPFVFV